MHRQFMIAALEQARLGQGICAPNPSVGAVVVHNNEIIARAWHQGAGKAHAEQLVLEHLPSSLEDSILYVTLEPCNHWGKTPPCVDAIINAGIKTVIFGFRDPNPQVKANDTPGILSAEGISVLHFPMAEIDDFYQSYQFWTQTKKPWVTAKIAQTLDGKIAGINGQRVHLSNELCATFTHEQRLLTDIILTSATTIINDNPALNVRLPGIKKNKPIAILDRGLRLPESAQIFTTAQCCHVYYDQALTVQRPRENCFYHPMPVVDKHLDLSAIILHLGGLGFHDVWVEAGGRVFSSLHALKLVNTTYLYLVPRILGEQAAAAYQCDNVFGLAHSVRWQAADDNSIARIEWEHQCLQE